MATQQELQAIEDGVLVDVTEWAGSGSGGMMLGFTVPVALTRALWVKVDVDSKKGHRGCQSTRGHAHDVLWLASVAARRHYSAFTQGAPIWYVVKVGNRNLRLQMQLDGNGVAIGFPEDF